MTKFFLAYLTCPDEKKARELAHLLLEKKLVACANIIPKMTSLYVWKGEIQEDQECLLFLKGAEKAESLKASKKNEREEEAQTVFKRIEEEVKKAHPYECPCLISLPITRGSEDFLTWIDEQMAF